MHLWRRSVHCLLGDACMHALQPNNPNHIGAVQSGVVLRNSVPSLVNLETFKRHFVNKYIRLIWAMSGSINKYDLNGDDEEDVVTVAVVNEETHILCKNALEFLETGKYSDVTFIVGEERILAHKLYCRVKSSVFDELFNAKPVKAEFEVPIPGIQANDFRNLLKYIYTGIWVTNNVVDTIAAFRAANYYKLLSAMPELKRKIFDIYLLEETSLDIFREAVKYNETELIKAATEEICKHAYELVDKEAFLTLSSECIEKLISRDDLAVRNEIQLFKALERWAEAARKSVITPKLPRAMLEKLVPLIRFPLMDSTDFSAYCTEILTKQQVVEVFQYMTAGKPKRSRTNSTLTFSCKPRKYATNSTMENLQLYIASRPRVFMEINADDECIGLIIFELRVDIVPRTAKNFRALCTGENGIGYKGSLIYGNSRKRGMCVCGCSTPQGMSNVKSKQDSTPVYSDVIAEESSKLKSGLGALSMLPYSGGCFYIAISEDFVPGDAAVVCGSVLTGLDVVKKIAEDYKSKRIVIADSGHI